MAVNASFVSPTADAKVAQVMASFNANGLVSRFLNDLTWWKLVLTVLMLAVAYDQCTSRPEALLSMPAPES